MLDIRDFGRWAVVVVRGDLDLATAPSVRARVVSLIQAGRADVVVDLSDVGFIDSTGIGALAGCAKRLDAVGGALVLVGLQMQVERTLAVMGMGRAFRSYTSLDELAVAEAIEAAGPWSDGTEPYLDLDMP